MSDLLFIYSLPINYTFISPSHIVVTSINLEFR